MHNGCCAEKLKCLRVLDMEGGTIEGCFHLNNYNMHALWTSFEPEILIDWSCLTTMFDGAKGCSWRRDARQVCETRLCQKDNEKTQNDWYGEATKYFALTGNTSLRALSVLAWRT